MYTVFVTSSGCLMPSMAACAVLYCPAGVKSRLPSGAKVRRRKKDVNVSLAYMFVFRTPKAPGRGDLEGITAGNGRDGEGETDLRTEEEPNDDRRLCEVGGGFIERAIELGVPGCDGIGEPSLSARVLSLPRASPRICLPVVTENSGGAGLDADILLAGRSILATLWC